MNFFGVKAAFEKKARLQSFDDLSRDPDKKAVIVRFQPRAPKDTSLAADWATLVK